MDRRLTNPKGSNVYSIGNFGLHATLKGSNVYRKNGVVIDSTPLGSHILESSFFYEHQIPSGLFLETIEADIQKGLVELKELM